jgi:hypothetical protein
MPSSLVQTLRELAKNNHFLDISEEVRSIIKTQVRTYRIRLGEIKPLEEEKPKVDFKTENMVKEELVRRLKNMIEELEHE